MQLALQTPVAAPLRPGAWLVVVAAGLAFGYLGALGLLAAHGGWILGSDGRPNLTDFTAVWSAGRLALHGAGLAAYNAPAERTAEAATIGHDFSGFLGWPYPPAFLFAAAALASAPYAAAFAAWVGGGLALHVASVAAVARRPLAAVVAFASPWALACVMVGQNGFLTAALMAFSLLALEERPILAGLALGLLAYKPQFGLLFPLALAAGGRWRAFASAAVTALALNGLAMAVFGPQTLVAFLQGLPQTGRTLVDGSVVGWNKLQSLYGLARCLGAGNAAGWVLQGLLIAACAVVVVLVWRGRAAFPLKAAAVASASLLATPYVFAYDLPILAVPLAFLYRQRPFDRTEQLALAAAALAVLPFLLTPTPSGLFASLTVAAVVARRMLAERSAAA